MLPRYETMAEEVGIGCAGGIGGGGLISLTLTLALRLPLASISVEDAVREWLELLVVSIGLALEWRLLFDDDDAVEMGSEKRTSWPRRLSSWLMLEKALDGPFTSRKPTALGDIGDSCRFFLDGFAGAPSPPGCCGGGGAGAALSRDELELVAESTGGFRLLVTIQCQSTHLTIRLAVERKINIRKSQQTIIIEAKMMSDDLIDARLLLPWRACGVGAAAATAASASASCCSCC